MAGCRLIVPEIKTQDTAVKSLVALFDQTNVVDRRLQPSHGYRAVHLIVSIDGKPVEIQVRTSLQHLWAELSEKLSDLFDPGIKYGRGSKEFHEILMKASRLVADVDSLELKSRNAQAQLSDLLSKGKLSEEEQPIPSVREDEQALQRA